MIRYPSKEFFGDFKKMFPELFPRPKGECYSVNFYEFKIDGIMKSIFDSHHFDKMMVVIRKELINYARRLMFLNTNVKEIESNQQIFRYFMNHNKLRKFVLNSDIKFEGIVFNEHAMLGYSQHDVDRDDVLRNLKAFSSFIKELPDYMTNISNKKLKQFYSSVKNYETDSLDKVIKEYEKNEKEFSIGIVAEATKKGNKIVVMKDTIAYDAYITINDKAESVLGKTRGCRQPDYIQEIVKKACEELGKKYKIESGDRIDALGETIKQISKKAEGEKVEFSESIFLSAVYFAKLQTTLVQLKDSEGKIIHNSDLKGEISSASKEETVIKWYNEKHFNKMNEKVLQPFSSSFYELKYAAILASVFNQFKRMKNPLTAPKMLHEEENKAELKGMLYSSLAFHNNWTARRLDRFKGDDPLREKIEKIVPNDFKYNKKENIFLITGPNSNGKTVFLYTIGQMQFFAQCGWFLPCEKAVLSVKKKIITPSLEHGTDSYKHESLLHTWIESAKEVCERIGDYDLVLLDELYRGASPEDGFQLSHEALEALSKTNATVLLVSHYHDLVKSTKNIPYMQYLKADSKKRGNKLQYTYKIKPGFSKTSEGIYLAKKLEGDKSGLIKILEKRKKLVR